MKKGKSNKNKNQLKVSKIIEMEKKSQSIAFSFT